MRDPIGYDFYWDNKFEFKVQFKKKDSYIRKRMYAVLKSILIRGMRF